MNEELQIGVDLSDMADEYNSLIYIINSEINICVR